MDFVIPKQALLIHGGFYVRISVRDQTDCGLSTLPDLPAIIAPKKRYKENLIEKYDFDTKYGWYRYDTKFALPVYNEDQELERFNVFQAVLLIRHAQDGKLYLYDLVNIKKETGKPLEQ